MARTRYAHSANGGCRDLGAHIDGFIATEATTVVVQSDASAPVTGLSHPLGSGRLFFAVSLPVLSMQGVTTVAQRLPVRSKLIMFGACGEEALVRLCFLIMIASSCVATTGGRFNMHGLVRAVVAGRAADVISAAATAMEAALRLIRPGRKIADVAEPLRKVGPVHMDGSLQCRQLRGLSQLIAGSSAAYFPQHKLIWVGDGYA